MLGQSGKFIWNIFLMLICRMTLKSTGEHLLSKRVASIQLPLKKEYNETSLTSAISFPKQKSTKRHNTVWL